MLYSMQTKITFRLLEIMIQRGLGITQLAKMSGLSRPTIYALRDNTADGVALATLGALCTALAIEPGELFAVWAADPAAQPQLAHQAS